MKTETPVPAAAVPAPLLLTTAGGAAVKALIREINEISALLEIKHREAKRLTDMIQRDAGLDPDLYLIQGVDDVKEQAFLRLVNKPTGV